MHPTAIAPTQRASEAPAALSVRVGTDAVPENGTIVAADSVEITVTRPLRTGGSTVVQYTAQADVVPSFDSTCGDQREQQRIVVSSTAPITQGGDFKVGFAVGADATDMSTPPASSSTPQI